MPDRPLTLKQEIFCRKYIEVGGNASEAFRQAYPVAKWKVDTVWQAACRLMAHSKVRARIQQLTRDAATAASVTPNRIIAEYCRMAFVDPRKLFTEDGNLWPVTALDDDTAAAVASIEHEDTWEGSGNERQKVGRLRKIKLVDKRAALDSLSKLMGMLVERHEHTGAGGGPIRSEVESRSALTVFNDPALAELFARLADHNGRRIQQPGRTGDAGDAGAVKALETVSSPATVELEAVSPDAGKPKTNGVHAPPAREE